jgi:hypothetical protein
LANEATGMLGFIAEDSLKTLRSFPDFAGKERFAFGEQRTSCPLAFIV